MRTPVIAGNWKLFKTIGEATSLVSELKPLVAGATGVEIVVAPVFTALSRVADIAAGSNVQVAAQDCFWKEEGAYTGEVAPKLLKDAGCSHVIIGHSERRQFFGETDQTVNNKAKAALDAGLTAIVCVGETLAEREAGVTFAVIGKQVKEGLAGLSVDNLARVIVAYEPVWAIGTGKTASDEQAQEVHASIRALIGELFGTSAAAELRILYGGSVKPDNVKGLMTQADIDGALVGGASLVAESFAAIVNYGA
ncbi:triose-phosphate isomerase [Geobacter sp. SVR]|uniref:triose-phosphate isomerase n=1 Tax=Geobacter sp. SVR TaxID=2495594 RepID=UPI00143EF9BB|nr:triose-phosphate isomerase [Geobacter sp. SVR]BCS53545.1 triosephosphate isomerase [Geobacter sp. SVR]GCF84258.1 triosephosphate isomerase [Geobacter sp. SVR]